MVVTIIIIGLHHVFIINPTAGKGRAVKMVDYIRTRFNDSSETYEIRITKAPGHAKTMAMEYSVLNERPIRLYSVGGDGTLNEVINGIGQSGIELGIIPCGSGFLQ